MVALASYWYAGPAIGPMPPVSSSGNSADSEYEYQTSGCVTGGSSVSPVLFGDSLTGFVAVERRPEICPVAKS